MIRKFKNYSLILIAIIFALLSASKFIGLIYVIASDGIAKESIWYFKQLIYAVALISIAIPMYWKGKDDLEEIKDEQEN